MSYPATQCYVIEVVGERQVVGALWDGQCGSSTVPALEP